MRLNVECQNAETRNKFPIFGPLFLRSLRAVLEATQEHRQPSRLDQNFSDLCAHRHQLLGHGSFLKLGVPYFGVLIIGSYYLGYYIRVPHFRKLPHRGLAVKRLGLAPPLASSKWRTLRTIVYPNQNTDPGYTDPCHKLSGPVTRSPVTSKSPAVDDRA